MPSTKLLSADDLETRHGFKAKVLLAQLTTHELKLCEFYITM